MNYSKIFVTALASGLLSSAVVRAEETAKPAEAKKEVKAEGKEKNSCKGEEGKHSCKGKKKHHKGDKDSCKGKDGCNGKGGCDTKTEKTESKEVKKEEVKK